MKKYAFIVFLLFLWCIPEAFVDPWRLLGVASVAAALACVLLIRKPVVGLLCAAGICVITAFFFPDFALRFAPVLLLLSARGCAAGGRKNKERAGNNSNFIYTMELFTVSVCIAALAYDISFFVRNPVKYSIQPFDWILFSSAVCTVFLTVYAFTHKTAVGKMQSRLSLFSSIAVCVMSVGYVLNAFNYDVYVFVFPWLIYLAQGGDSDPVTVSASEWLNRWLQSRLSSEE